MNSSTAPAQLPLSLRDPRWRPVADTDGVKWALDIEAEEADSLIDLGHLIAFNIAVRPFGRRELRFLTRSLEHYRATLGSRMLHLELPEILRLMIPHDKPVISGTEIDTALNCDPDHRQNLIRAGELKLLDGTAWKAGPGGSPVVTRTSFLGFLTRRRL